MPDHHAISTDGRRESRRVTSQRGQIGNRLAPGEKRYLLDHPRILLAFDPLEADDVSALIDARGNDAGLLRRHDLVLLVGLIAPGMPGHDRQGDSDQPGTAHFSVLLARPPRSARCSSAMIIPDDGARLKVPADLRTQFLMPSPVGTRKRQPKTVAFRPSLCSDGTLEL